MRYQLDVNWGVGGGNSTFVFEVLPQDPADATSEDVRAEEFSQVIADFIDTNLGPYPVNSWQLSKIDLTEVIATG